MTRKIRNYFRAFLATAVLTTCAYAQYGVSTLTNKSGSSVAKYDVVVWDSSNSNAFKKTTTSRDTTVIGVVIASSIANNSTGQIVQPGAIVKVRVTGTVTRGDYLVTSTTAGAAASGGTANISGAFAIALETGTNTNVNAYTISPNQNINTHSLAALSISLPDDTGKIIYGNDSDIQALYDETTDDRLEYSDGTNLLGWRTDTGSWGRLGSSGIIEARRNATTISVTSITRSSQTATVTTASAHGLKTSDMGTITGANETAYNGTFRVTVTGTTTFTFTVDGTPTTPATGTILFKPNVQLLFYDESSTGPFNIVADGNVSYLNPGSTTVAHIITNRDSGHLIFDIYGNDARDSIAFRTNSSTGTLDAIDTILMVLNCNNRVGILNSNPSTTLDVTGTGNFTSSLTVGGTFTANGTGQFGDASTDVITFTGRMLPRSVTDAGPMTATPGTKREIVFNTSDNKWYGCTVTHGTAATWVALN